MHFEPDDRPFSKAQARSIYLAAIKKLYPDVLVSLRNEVMPAFVSDMQSAYQHDPALRIEELSRATITRAARNNSSLKGVVVTVDSWCERWNIKSEWLIDTVFRTLDRWSTFRAAEDVLEWHLGGFGYFEPESYREGVEFRFRAWNPISGEGRKEYSDEATKAFAKYLNHYLGAWKESMKANGWIERGGFPNDQYVKWLAMNRIGRLSPFEIAKREYPNQWKPGSHRDDFIKEIDRVKLGIRRAIAVIEPK